MSAPDRPETTSPEHSVPGTTPAPVAADLATDSNDPQELRRLLDRARERLSFYESFDRIIGENLRRTGEMMEETVALREQAKQAADEADRAREAAVEAASADRERYRALVEAALGEVRSARPVIDRMISTLEGAIDELSGEVGPGSTEDEPAALPEPVAESTQGAVTTASGDEAAPDTTAEALDVETVEPGRSDETIEAVTAPEEDEPEQAERPDTTPQEGPAQAPAQEVPGSGVSSGTIDVIAHGVPSAAMAIGLQQMLRELDTVSRVDAREFADGELRLQVECTGPFPEQPLADWLSQNSGSLVSRNGKSVELSFP